MPEPDADENLSNITFESNISEMQPPPTTFKCNTVLVFILLGFYFLAFGIVELVTNFQDNKYEIVLKRENNSFTANTPLMSFSQGSQIAIYLSIPELTQLDFEETQSGGDIMAIAPLARNCKTQRFNYQLNKSINMLGGALIPTNYAVPCGEFSSNYPQGNFTIRNLENGSLVQFMSNDLTIFGERIDSNFNQVKQWADLTDGKFRSWMEANAQLGLFKFWGQLNGSLSGKFQFQYNVNNPLPSQVDKIIIIFDDNGALDGYDTQLCGLNIFFTVKVFIFSLAVYLIKSKIQTQEGRTISIEFEKTDSMAIPFKSPASL